jgi:putative tryptophan/tyrosine transport system substrate-binding protein
LIADPSFIARQLVALGAGHAMPAIYRLFRRVRWADESWACGRELVSAGRDTERILKGAKPVDLPIQQNIRYELVINLKTAKAVNLSVPPSLLARADELIE